MGSGCRHTSAQGFEGGLSRLPMNRKCEQSRGCGETRYVCGNIIGLNDILGVLVVGISPAADLDVHLAVALIRAQLVVGEKAEYSSRFHTRNILHGKKIGSVAETARHNHF